MKCTPVVDRCSSLSNVYAKQADDSLHAPQTATSPLRRLFAGGKAKVLRIMPGDNPGITILVLKELY